MWATNGFPEYFRFPRYFQPVAFIRMSRRLERLSAIYRSTSSSLLLSSLISVATLSTSSRSILFRRLFSVETRLHTLYYPQKPLDCEFPWRRKGARAVSFLVEEISGLDHAIDFHASPVSVFLRLSLSLPSRSIICRVYRDCKQSELDISRIDWNASI